MANVYKTKIKITTRPAKGQQHYSNSEVEFSLGVLTSNIISIPKELKPIELRNQLKLTKAISINFH
jgi:hypothetical protein